jgi:hypothetical protein
MNWDFVPSWPYHLGQDSKQVWLGGYPERAKAVSLNSWAFVIRRDVRLSSFVPRFSRKPRLSSRMLDFLGRLNERGIVVS